MSFEWFFLGVGYVPTMFSTLSKTNTGILGPLALQSVRLSKLKKENGVLRLSSYPLLNSPRLYKPKKYAFEKMKKKKDKKVLISIFLLPHSIFYLFNHFIIIELLCEILHCGQDQNLVKGHYILYFHTNTGERASAPVFSLCRAR